MGLKLFRNTGYSTLLDARTAVAWQHPQRAAAANPLKLLLLVSIWLGTVCNAALWRELYRIGALQTAGDWWFAAGLAVMVISAIAALGALLAWRLTIKPFLLLMLLIAALGAHFMTSYSVVIDTTMIANVLQTDPRESRELVNWKLLVTLLVLFVLPGLWLLAKPVRKLRFAKQLLLNALFLIAACAVLAAAGGIFFKNFSSLMRNQQQLRFLINPLNSVYALADLASKPLQRGPLKLQTLGLDAKLGPSYSAVPANTAGSAPTTPPVLLLVLGETARAGNFSINGYDRPTTPELSALMATDLLASARNAWSCGTNTAASVPCMFSHLGREAYPNRSAQYENVLDLLQRAGLAVLWLDNQSGCKGVCDRVPTVDTSQEKTDAFCNTGECFDAIMLDRLDQRIAALPAAQRAKGVVVVMHQMGSHGPAYYKRVPAQFKKFTPECATNALQDCSRDQVVNSYDNTIAYTDHFLASSIRWLKNRGPSVPTAMVYVADHGESLGENNLYLHGLPYAIAPDVQKRVPWITWQSPAFAQRSRVSTACLRANANAAISHDNYFHSVLGLMDVRSAVYRKELDIYAACVK